MVRRVGRIAGNRRNSGADVVGDFAHAAARSGRSVALRGRTAWAKARKAAASNVRLALRLCPPCAAVVAEQPGSIRMQYYYGLALDKTDGVHVTRSLNDTSKPSGMASQIFQCALSNTCTSCFP